MPHDNQGRYYKIKSENSTNWIVKMETSGVYNILNAVESDSLNVGGV